MRRRWHCRLYRNVLLVASVAYAVVLTRRDPALGERVGAVVATVMRNE